MVIIIIHPPISLQIQDENETIIPIWDVLLISGFLLISEMPPFSNENSWNNLSFAM